jgi:hypothetical protein
MSHPALEKSSKKRQKSGKKRKKAAKKSGNKVAKTVAHTALIEKH